MAAVAYGSASATVSLYPTAVSRAALASGVASNPATAALYGPSGDLGTLGGLATWKLSGIGAVAISVLGILLVIRHTRAEEEAGRRELIGAGAVGRRAPFLAAVIEAISGIVAIGAVTAIGLGVGGLPWWRSVAFAAGLAGTGAFFVAVGVFAAQLTDSARPARGIAAMVLGVAYLLRAVGDASGGDHSAWPSWASPLGWAQQMRPYGPLRWTPLLLVVVATCVVGLVAERVASGRDLEVGLLPSRSGPTQGAASFRSPLALAWRLQRGALVAWSAGALVFGGVSGAIAAGVGDLVKDSPQALDLFEKLGGSRFVVDAYLATMMSFLGLLASAYAVSAVLRLHTEESEHRLEPLLATPVGRIRWAGGHLALGALGSGVIVAIGGLAAGISHGIRTHEIAPQLSRLLLAALAQLPAVFVVAGVAIVLYGVAPRASSTSWGVLGLFLVLGQLGPVIGLPGWAMDLSPFSHLPRMPGGGISPTPFIWMLTVAVGLASLGLVAFRARDIS